jgi:hypothetical protein
MEKVDRLGWADGFTFSSFGVKIGIRSNQPGLTEALHSVLPPGHRPSSSSAVQRLYSLVIGGSQPRGGARRLNILYDGAQRLCREPELGPVLKILETQIRRAVAQMAPRRVFVHAGVVAHRGRAIIIPGASLSGKSTLVSELIKLGATYYSDEFAVLDHHGRVTPFAKPLSLRAPGCYEGSDYAVEHFGASVGVKAIPIGLVVITRYVEGAKWRPQGLSVGQGALAMLANAITAREQPRRVLGALQRGLEKASIVKGIRGEASAVAAQILGEMATFDASSAVAGFSDVRQYQPESTKEA